MRGLTSAVPVYVVLADLWYGLVLNVAQSLDEPSRNTPNIIPTVPDVAFNWLQVLANAGMVLVMTFALWQLLQLNKAVARKQVFHMSAFRVLGLVLTLAFSLPALYGIILSLLHLLTGHITISLANIRYFVTAVCIAYCAALCLRRLLGWRRTRKTLVIATPAKNADVELVREAESN
ncbi:hypothetical protein LVJ82_06530 [Vitreoscilla massiliensis]|uniref:Transmembrane protein n=1 Tax=Vitreoscilla massiliensis TaxID=1689272 RepID=A0ABY4E4D4_9NEIS|nr:hypothetical protein [Vitreoscilla massiliensis]UOO90626.1 hypothetical protein LVJ82_06530 [Vitreoscilla massiliensis]